MDLITTIFTTRSFMFNIHQANGLTIWLLKWCKIQHLNSEKFLYSVNFFHSVIFLYSETFLYSDTFLNSETFSYSEHSCIQRPFYIQRLFYIQSHFYVQRHFYIQWNLCMHEKIFLKMAVSKMLRSFSVEQPCWSPFEVHLQVFLRTFLRLLLEKGTPK